MFRTTGKSPEEIENFYGYTLGRALENCCVLFHGASQMGDHHHVDGTDVQGNRPEFKDLLHSTLARGLNAKHLRVQQAQAKTK